MYKGQSYVVTGEQVFRSIIFVYDENYKYRHGRL